MPIGIVVVVAILASAKQCEADGAMSMLDRALRATEQVRDYTATVTVRVDSPNLQIPRRTARVYFKRPDMVHVESEGLVFIPRDALMMGNLSTHVEEYATASFIGDGTLGGRPVRSIKLTPREDRPGAGRVLVWIDSERFLLLRSEIWRGGRRQLTVNFEHERIDGRYWMPGRIVAEMAAGAMMRRDEGGRIELVFSNYRINTDLPDSIFERDH